MVFTAKLALAAVPAVATGAAQGGQARPGEPAQAPLLVWTRLGTFPDWPSTIEELGVEARLRAMVRRTAGTIRRAGHANVVAWVEPELKAEGPKRWQRAFNSIALGKVKDKDAALDEAVKLAANFAILNPGTDPALAPAVRLRFLVFDLKRKVRGLGRKASKTQVEKLVDAFARAAAALPGRTGSKAQVRALVSELRQAVAAADEKGGAGLEKAGPATFAAGGWQVEAMAEDGSTVAYKWSQTGATLRFVRVEPTKPADARPAYLCTTEFPVGLLASVITAAGRWPDAADLLMLNGLTQFDKRKGPRTWRVLKGGGARLGVARRWLVPLAGMQPYPDGVATPRPSRSHPVQYVTPEGAMFAARLLVSRSPAKNTPNTSSNIRLSLQEG